MIRKALAVAAVLGLAGLPVAYAQDTKAPPKGRRATELSKAPEPEPPEEPQENSQHVEAPVVPKLQPFEE